MVGQRLRYQQPVKGIAMKHREPCYFTSVPGVHGKLFKAVLFYLRYQLVWISCQFSNAHLDCNLPYACGGDQNFVCVPNDFLCVSGQTRIAYREPEEDMRVEQNWHVTPRV